MFSFQAASLQKIQNTSALNAIKIIMEHGMVKIANVYARFLNTCFRCAKCNQYVEGEVVSALGNTFHQKCFTCARWEILKFQFHAYHEIIYLHHHLSTSLIKLKLNQFSDAKTRSLRVRGSLSPGKTVYVRNVFKRKNQLTWGCNRSVCLVQVLEYTSRLFLI